MFSAVLGGLRTSTRRRPSLLAGALAAALSGGLLLASPAWAVTDPTAPTASLAYGPNCVDGYVRVDVQAGTEPRTVELTYNGYPASGAVDLGAGDEVQLEGGEVASGTTVDVGVAVTSDDGPQAPLGLGTYTRPSQEDCDAVLTPPPTATTTLPDPGTPTTTAPTTGRPTSGAPSTASPTTAPPTTAPTTTATPTPGVPAPSSGSVPTGSQPPTGTPSTPTPPGPATTAPRTPAPSTGQQPTSTSSAPLGGTSSSGEVSPGSVVTIRGTGFTPGEQVTVTLAESSVPLATVVADEQGAVEAVVQIPQDTGLGAAVVQLVGEQSAQTAGVDLEVAAVELPAATGRTPWPLLAAGLALLGVAVALASAAARRPRRDDWQQPGGVTG